MKIFKRTLICALIFCLSASFFMACDTGGTTPVANTYTVTFNAEGGTLSGGETEVKVTEGKALTLPSATLQGFKLDGWYDQSVLAGVAGASYTPIKDVTLKAKWTAEIVTPDYAKINRDRAVEYAKNIYADYWNPDTQKSSLTPQGGVPFLWPYTEQAAMANAILEITPKTDADYEFFKSYLEGLLEGLRYYRCKTVSAGAGESWNNENHVLAEYGVNDGSANSYAIYQAGRNDKKDSNNASFSGVYFDDNVWVAKEFYFAYKNLGDVKYLNESVNIMNWIIGEGYEPTQGMNGVYWNWGAKFKHPGETDDNKNASLNACSAAPAAMMLVKLYQTFSEPALEGKFDGIKNNYLSTAKKIYNFLWSNLLDTEQYVLCDKVFVNKSGDNLVLGIVDRQQLPYNTGTFMTLGAELVKVSTGTAATLYKERNTLVASGADRKFANTLAVSGQYSYNKNSWFTSFLIDGYIDILPNDQNCETYLEHMRSALDYGYLNNRAEDGYVSPAWVVGWSEYNDDNIGSEGNPRQILLQSANAHCYAMLARYYAA